VRSSQAFVVTGLVAALVALAGCGSDEATPGESVSPSPSASASTTASPAASATPSKAASKIRASSTLDKVTVRGEYGKAPKVTVDKPWAIDQTRTKVLKDSDGPKIGDGATVTVDYLGVNARTGKTFDSSYSRGMPASFPLDQVVPGFKKGLLGQRLGSRVLIAMPGPDGYDGGGGNPQAGIEVGDTLIFVVDIIRPLTGPEGKEVAPAAGLPTVSKGRDPQITVPKTEPPRKLVVQPLIKGTGPKVTAEGTLTINYRYVTWADGKVIEENYSTKPDTAPLGQLISGMQKGLVGQPVGSRLLLVIPPADGYPNGNTEPKIAKGQTLVMVVDLLLAA
jgi:peptidylprolyl isomerase